jgi:hypothetical protein
VQTLKPESGAMTADMSALAARDLGKGRVQVR